MHIMTPQQVYNAAAKAFKDNTVTMTAETHPQEFRCFLTVCQQQGKYWGIKLENEE